MKGSLKTWKKPNHYFLRYTIKKNLGYKHAKAKESE